MQVSIRSYKTRIEAEIAKGFLEANGIVAEISADDGGGMYVFPMQYSYGVELLVDEHEKEKAQILLTSASKK